MAGTEERLQTLEFDLNRFKSETTKAYSEMAVSVTMVQGLIEDSIKRQAAFRNEMAEFRAEVNDRFNRLDSRLGDIVASLAAIQQKLEET